MLFDFSQIALPTDNVDASFTHKPRQWNIDIVKKFMLYLGPLTSLFDILTFMIMLIAFKASQAMFQTGWFIESLASQVLVIFVVRTALKCWKSRPSWPLVLSVVLILSLALILPYTPLGRIFGFVSLPFQFYLFLLGTTVLFLVLMEKLKTKLLFSYFHKN